MWERFSFYGLRPLLILFMTAALKMAASGLNVQRHRRSSASMLPRLSRIAARRLDRRPASRPAAGDLLGAMLITLGHISIGIASLRAPWPFFVGLVFIVLGTGLLKPNISAIVGDLYPEGGERRDAGFSIFYMGINTGGFGQIVTGILGEKYGFHWDSVPPASVCCSAYFGSPLVGARPSAISASRRSRAPDPTCRCGEESMVKIVVGVGLAIIASWSPRGRGCHRDRSAGYRRLYALRAGRLASYFSFTCSLQGAEQR